MLLGDFAIGRTVGNSARSISPNGAVIVDSPLLNQDSLENSGNKGSTLQDTVIIEDTVKVLDGRKTLDSRRNILADGETSAIRWGRVGLPFLQ